jgi:putative DNA primase/helicase
MAFDGKEWGEKRDADEGYAGDHTLPPLPPSDMPDEPGDAYEEETPFGYVNDDDLGRVRRAPLDEAQPEPVTDEQPLPCAKPAAAEQRPAPSANGQHAKTKQPKRRQQRADMQPGDVHLTDVGNCLRFVQDHGADAHYVHDWKKWLFWDGKRWAIDHTGEAELRAKETVKKLFDEARKEFAEAAKALKGADPDDEETIARLKARQLAAQKLVDFALRSEHVQRIDGMLKLARSEPGIPVLPAQLDTDLYSLNLENGTVDLRSGSIRPHDPRDLITKLAPHEFDPEATCPLWEKTLRGIFAGDQEMIAFFQRFSGYCSTGCVHEDITAIAHGDGSNGKTIVTEVELAVLGKDYADAAGPDLLVKKKGERHPTELADLHGKRLVICHETEGDLNEALLKRLSGKDTVKGRRMREDLWSFDTTHKFVMCTNHKPTVKGQDHGIWRRLILIPFEVKFWREDLGETGPEELRAILDLKERLKAEECGGILSWMVAGAMEWFAHGLRPPQKVLIATQHYRQDQDRIGAFIEERCVTGNDYRVKASDIYSTYVAWVKTSNEGEPLPQRKFGTHLTQKRFERLTNNGIWYRGIAVRKDFTEGTEG